MNKTKFSKKDIIILSSMLTFIVVICIIAGIRANFRFSFPDESTTETVQMVTEPEPIINKEPDLYILVDGKYEKYNPPQHRKRDSGNDPIGTLMLYNQYQEMKRIWGIKHMWP